GKNANSMNLPPDKMKVLCQYDNEKKWELVCDQERFQVKNPPSAYLLKLKSYLDQGGVSRKPCSDWTNHIGWAQEFLNEENCGLDVLVDYLSFAQCAVTYDMDSLDNGTALDKSVEDLTRSVSNSPTHGATRATRALTPRKALRNSRLVGQKDDVHLCIMCLRAIMNYQSGFNLVMAHPCCVNEITLSLNNRSPRTKALVLELLAAVCLVRGGHDIILSAFDNFKEVCGEKSRFEKLMEYFCNEDSNIDFMVACMQFINIVVHSVENMNFRVHLQYEFTHHGLDDYLERLKFTESDRLQVQIQAYLDNLFDVGALLEDAETKNALLEHMEELQEHNTQVIVHTGDNTHSRNKMPIQTKHRLPLLNWQALKPHQVAGTVFSELDDEHVLGELNMDAFEEQFKTKAQTAPVDVGTLRAKVSRKTSSKVSLLEPNRAKNLAITLRKGGMTASDICNAIETYNQEALSLDFLELLERFIPSEYEVKLIQNYERDGRPLDELPEEDRFMVRFSKIPRLAMRISTLTFMGNFPESIQLIQPQLNAIITASMSIKSSGKLKKILEIILAFGNYMNSSKRGAVYGFRLQSLDLLLDTKSTDRNQTLLHFIVNTIQEKYPDLQAFYHELHFMEKAALVSLDSVLQDVHALERGMELTQKEFALQEDRPVLQEFLARNKELLDSVIKDGKTAQNVYEAVVEYFGENPKTTTPSMFFPVFVRFIKAYKQAEQENEQRKKEVLQMTAMPKMPQMDLIAELKKRQVTPLVREGKDGAIEDIITALKAVPFTARSGKRSSRLFCDSGLSDESPT
uniref:Formin-like 1a n=1 Tax=Esox lucius TaxID=8010 RepID=A0A6Q2YSR4_ESOLU